MRNNWSWLQKKGEIDAFETLFSKYSPIVYKLFKEYYIQGFDFDDWIQEGQIVCYHSIASFDLDKGFSFGSFFKLNFKRHIISIIRHQNALKRKLDFSAVSLEGTLEEQGEHCLIKENNIQVNAMEYVLIRDTLKSFIEQLSKFERKVFKLYVKGLSCKEISTLLVCPIARVNNALDRIKKKMKVHLC